MEKILYCLKKHCFAIALLFFAKATIPTAFAQVVTVGINYQAIARDTTGLPFSDTTINVKFSIYDALSGGNMDYTEEHLSVQTNKYGLFTLVIGSQNQSVFDTINWTASNKYLQVEIELIPNGYIQMPGRSKFQGVPYAHAAKTAFDSWHTDGNTIVGTPKFIGTKNAADFVVKTSNDTSMVIAPNGDVHINRGNIGVGMTPLPLSSIAIKNTLLEKEIEFYSTTPSVPADIVAHSMLNIGTETAHAIQIKTNNSAKVLIDTSGNVGIGTQTPTAKLDVAGTVRISDTLKVEDKIKITDGTEGAGKILTSDATGLASWETLSLGTVTQVTADSLLPLFTTQVLNDSTTPHIEFTLENANAYTVFGNGTSSATQPNYYKPILASPLFENQGTTSTVLHGNASGDPLWGPIVNADITNGTIDLGTKVTGTLPIANGGTNAITVGNAGSVAYSSGTAYNFTSSGTDGQVLESTGIGTPVWRKRVLNISGDSIITATTTDTSNYTLSVAMNSDKYSGAVLRGDQFPNRVWKTDASGIPAWRTDSSGISYVMGTGLTLFGNMINSTWTQSGNNIYNNNTANVGIGTNTPVNKLDVEGGVAIGTTYSGLSAAPTNGAIIQGKVGIGIIAPGAQLHVVGSNTTESAGYFANILNSSTVSTLVATSNSNSTVATLFTANTGLGGALGTSISNPANNSHAIESVTAGTGDAVNATNTGNGRAGTFRITNTSSTANTALRAMSDGTGKAGHFSLSSASNSAASLLAETAGSGNAIEASNTGTGRAGKFEITNSSSTADAFLVTSNGTGKGGVFKLTNASNTSEALSAETNGTGRVASFTNTNSANTSDAVFITTNGGTTTSGSKGLSVSNTGQGSNVINYGAYIESNGSGTGNTNIAGYFSATGANNNYAGIFANGNVGIGTTAPTSPLTVQTKSGTELEFVSTGTNADISANAQFNIGSTTSTLNFLTNSLYRLVIDFSGNVGVGTTAPASLFHSAGQIRTGIPLGGLGGAVATNGALLFYNSANTNTVNIQTGATSTSYTLTLPTAQGAANSILTNNGSGALSWTAGSSLNLWSSIGNTGTTAPTANIGSTINNNFIGTTDAKDFAFASNNLERMRITSTGNIGIGTKTPASPLHVKYNSSSLISGLTIENTNAGNTAYTSISLVNNIGYTGGISMNSSTNSLSSGFNGMNVGTNGPANLQLGTNSYPRVTIDTAGNVGIGTGVMSEKLRIGYVGGLTDPFMVYNLTSASTTFHLTKDHKMIFSPNTNSTSTLIEMGYGVGNISGAGTTFMKINPATVASGSNVFSVEEGGTKYLTVTGDGNVGIGTNTPVSKLDVEGGVSIGAGYSGTSSAPTNGLIVQGNVGLGVTNAINKLDIGGALAIGSTYANSSLAPTNGAIIEGNVGIGTASPTTSVKLHLYNNVNYANQLKIENPNAGGAASSMLSLYNNTGNSAFINFGSSANTSLAGNNGLAIGTVPAGKVQFYTKNTARVTIDTTGNVGIGTETPATNSRLAIKDGHLQSQQTTAPNFSGLSVTTLNVTNSTDIAGNLTFTPSSFAAVGNLTVIFDKAYATPPIVVISPTNVAAANDLTKIYITSSTTGFIVNFTAGCSATSHNFSYHVIETY